MQFLRRSPMRSLALPVLLLGAVALGWLWNSAKTTMAEEEPPVPIRMTETPVELATQIAAERAAAEDLIATGDLLGAGAAMANSLRNLPVDHPEAMDSAYGTAQLLLYTMEYLMDEPVRNQFVTQTLQPDANEIDHFIVAGYNIYIGQETAGKTEAAHDLLDATTSSNPFARIGSLFILSDPYFFDNAEFTQQCRDLLGAEYPGLALTQESYRYTVYGARKEGPEKLSLAVARMASQEKQRQRSVKDPVIAAAAEAAPLLAAKSEDAGVGVYAKALGATSDWKARFGLLLMVEPYGRTHPDAVGQLCEAIGSEKTAQTGVTPDVVRARIMALKLARIGWTDAGASEGAQPPGFAWVGMLLNSRWTENPYERCLYEDVMKAVSNCAKHLGELHRPLAAIAVYRKLAGKYPNSLVSKHCEEEIAKLRPQPGPHGADGAEPGGSGTEGAVAGAG